MKILVSILIPAYNAEKWIDETIMSAINQTWKNKEIIIVDDGSNDNTYNIAKSYESNIVKVIKQNNGGASSARNNALSLAQGDYIQWLDADDILENDKIYHQMRRIEKEPNGKILFSSAWGQFFFRCNKAKFHPNSLWQNLTPIEWIFRKIDENAWMAIESWLVSRKITENAGPWNETLLRDNDGEYFNRVVLGCERVEFVPEAKSYCRIGNINSISSNANLSKGKIESIYVSICMSIECLLSLENSERTRKACIKLLQRWLIYFFPENEEILCKFNSIAKNAGGLLFEPKLKWKYEFIRYIFGWKAAKYGYFTFPKYKTYIFKNIDKIFYYLDKQSRA